MGPKRLTDDRVAPATDRSRLEADRGGSRRHRGWEGEYGGLASGDKSQTDTLAIAADEMLHWADADMYANKMSRRLPEGPELQQEPDDTGALIDDYALGN